MNTKVREYLIEVARKRTDQIVTYQKLCDDCDLKLDMYNNPNDRKIIGKILDDISTYEHENNRPLLSSLVVQSSNGIAGNGFYKLCRQLNVKGIESVQDDYEFLVLLVNDCINFWNNDEKYKLHKLG